MEIRSSRRWFPVIVLAMALIGFLAIPDSASAADITCASESGRYHRCSANTRGGVILLTQLSGAGCYEGSTWGSDDNGIWVANGCRAVFRTGSTNYNDVRSHGSSSSSSSGNNTAGAVAGIVLALGAAAAIHKAHEHDDDDDDEYYSNNHYSYRGRTQVVTCESVNGRYRECRADVGRHGRVHITHRLSDSGCRFDDDWGYDRDSIWVDNGCRARFEVER